MAIITLTSDFGAKDHYVGALKGAILSKNPAQVIVDISHLINNFDIAHGAFVVRSIIPWYPKGTVHLIAFDGVGPSGNSHLAVKMADQFFLLANHGMIGLLNDTEPQEVVELKPPETPSAFPALEILAPAAIALADGGSIEELGKHKPDYHRMVGREMRINKNQLLGHVIRVDHYGNLVTNIRKEAFCKLSKERSFTIVIGREQFRRLNNSISETGSGDCFVMFNSQGLLEVGINKGNACELLGLRFDSPIRVVVDESN